MYGHIGYTQVSFEKRAQIERARAHGNSQITKDWDHRRNLMQPDTMNLIVWYYTIGSCQLE